MKYFLAFLIGCFSVVVNAQPVTGVTYTNTSNLLSPTVSGWQGTVAGTYQGYSGGSTPAYNAATDTVIFGYTTKTAKQVIGINTALQGTGIQVGGYNYSWTINNDAASGNYGTLSGNVALKATNGSTLHSYNYTYNNQSTSWQTFSGTQWFPQEYATSALSNLELSFTGKDARFWAGYYGPQVRNAQLSLAYRVDPCVANPAYSPDCANYNQVLTSQTIYAQSYAINQALNLTGSGVQINGFKYGYDYYVGGDWCSSAFIICWQWSPSSLAVDVNVTSSSGTSLYTATHNHTDQNTSSSASYSYVFPNQRLLSTMGNFTLSPRETGTAGVYSSWSNWQYTPDPCVVNPLSSTSCSGYADAYKAQQCTISALYDSSCPGYAAAYLTLQCSINSLYNSACPGYAAAYYTQQCTINPLYDSGCPGYATAYKKQQCDISPLYATDCPGYAVAYKTQQCNLNGLYANDCPNYNEAYAKKNILGIGSTTTSSTTSSPTSTTVSTTEPAVQVKSDGKIDAASVPLVSDSNVNNVITTTTTSSTPSATAAVPLVSTPTTSPQGVSSVNTQTSSTQSSTKQEQSTTASSSSTRTTETKTETKSDQQKMKDTATAKAKEEMKKAETAATMEAQIATQGAVVGLMSFVPGFASYTNATIVDYNQIKMQRQYHKDTVDNRSVLRQLNGASDRIHSQMVDSQYNLGN